jgi:hypothetical protein
MTSKYVIRIFQGDKDEGVFGAYHTINGDYTIHTIDEVEEAAAGGTWFLSDLARAQELVAELQPQFPDLTLMIEPWLPPS